MAPIYEGLGFKLHSSLRQSNMSWKTLEMRKSDEQNSFKTLTHRPIVEKEFGGKNFWGRSESHRIPALELRYGA